jgi:ABC-type Fe3+-hydroxamate transport system substrate-binding protein
MYRLNARAILLAVAVLATGACSNNALSSVTTPTTTTTFTDTFTGTLSRNGSFTHSFTTANLGAVSASIVNLQPTSSQIVGLSLGVWNGTACSTSPATGGSSSDIATTGSSITLNATAAGSLCVRLYDVGFIDDPVLYTLQVTHP